MNKQFTDEQIMAYGNQFIMGDAIWSGGKWCEVVEYGSFGRLATKDSDSKNEYIINSGEDGILIVVLVGLPVLHHQMSDTE